MVSDVRTPFCLGTIVVNEFGEIFIVFVLTLYAVLCHCMRGISADVGFGCVVREGEEVKIMVNSVYLGGGDVVPPSLSIPSVKVLVNLLNCMFGKPALIELRLVGVFVSVVATSVLGAINMVKIPADKSAAVVIDFMFKKTDLFFPNVFVRSVEIDVYDP